MSTVAAAELAERLRKRGLLEIAQDTARANNLDTAVVLGRSRAHSAKLARHELFWRLRQCTERYLSLAQLAELLDVLVTELRWGVAAYTDRRRKEKRATGAAREQRGRREQQRVAEQCGVLIFRPPGATLFSEQDVVRHGKILCRHHLAARLLPDGQLELVGRLDQLQIAAAALPWESERSTIQKLNGGRIE